MTARSNRASHRSTGCGSTTVQRLGLLLIVAVAGLAAGACTTAESGPELVAAAPEKGFHYPYLLVIPETVESPAAGLLLVEPNNTGTVSDDLDVHLDSARSLAERGIAGLVSRSLGLPLLIPVFPRPETEWRIYTHALDRDAMLLRDGPMERLDLQLLAMVDDARARLGQIGRPVDPRLLLTGFSASGTFANRFTVLHPERVLAVASGGVNGLLMLPVADLESIELPYPLGISDIESLTGQPFDLETWRRVPQLIYMGSEDTNDAILFDDGYSDAERATIFAVIGEPMQPDRWQRCQEVYRDAGAAVTFRTYQGIGHRTTREINAEIIDFFRTAAASR